MLRRSIPDYEQMRSLATHYGCLLAQPGTKVVDIGCADGLQIEAMYRVLGPSVRYVGNDVSEPMLRRARERLSGKSEIQLRRDDLRHDFPARQNVSVVMSVLTLQFVPIEHRLDVLQRARASLVDGGGVILVEKIIGASARLDRAMRERYWTMKREHGYSVEDVERKCLSLEGVLVPLTARWNEEMLRLSGFAEVDCFWRWSNFCGWVALA